jgi:hypothetical protein
MHMPGHFEWLLTSTQPPALSPVCHQTSPRTPPPLQTPPHTPALPPATTAAGTSLHVLMRQSAAGTCCMNGHSKHCLAATRYVCGDTQQRKHDGMYIQHIWCATCSSVHAIIHIQTRLALPSQTPQLPADATHAVGAWRVCQLGCMECHSEPCCTLCMLVCNHQSSAHAYQTVCVLLLGRSRHACLLQACQTAAHCLAAAFPCRHGVRTPQACTPS